MAVEYKRVGPASHVLATKPPLRLLCVPPPVFKPTFQSERMTPSRHPLEQTLPATMVPISASTGCLPVNMSGEGDETITVVDPEGNVVSVTTYGEGSK
ncbi:hypothetical protein EV122DRAFT_289085 [Schizophyllum commune]